MHSNAFDRYFEKDSLIHHLDPRVKVMVTLLFIISNVLLPDGAWLAFLLGWGFILMVNLLAQLEPGYAFKRSFVALPFALAAVTTIFTISGQPVFGLTIGPWHLTGTDAGLMRFLSILIRSWLAVQMAILLIATTQFPDLMHALSHLRVPGVMVAIVSFMYRYLFVLVDETMRLLRAREARSARPAGGGGGGSIFWRGRVAGNMVGQLFLRSYDRSDRVYSAMLARGYQGQYLTMNPHVMQLKDWFMGIFAGILLLLIQFVGRLA